MARATDSMDAPRREDYENRFKGLLRLEAGINDVAQLARISANLSDETLSYDRAEKVDNEHVRLLLSREELDDLAFMAGETLVRARNLREAFYAALEGRAN